MSQKVSLKMATQSPKPALVDISPMEDRHASWEVLQLANILDFACYDGLPVQLSPEISSAPFRGLK
jgi:hypothetical protein